MDNAKFVQIIKGEEVVKARSVDLTLALNGKRYSSMVHVKSVETKRSVHLMEDLVPSLFVMKAKQ